LPASVFGPVERAAFRRFAASCSGLQAMAGLSG
jgi:hypothetical protein